ncbi:MAG: transglutaminase family protein [Atopobiaceae bacterium]|nr:transglutaminase family protein [Atopobiaceae bacterium]MCH4181006.1 transglutaminase family protein [Atopobiaceae bacterium]MCH4214918.1 transglutaminase family protein [Atopobiaceae bacterium]MCH4229754.1 transglutaminase family protein [Atopobiaceae bacterium]MCH4276049.1 transglutaminase family protein [Atopobiaceae bacterium]
MNKLRFSYQTELDFSEAVSGHRFQLRCLPPDLPQQRICDLELEISPACEPGHETDSFHNPVLIGSIDEPHETFSYKVSGLAFVDQHLIRTSPYKPLYRFQSDYTRQGPALAALTEEVRESILASGGKVSSPVERATFAMHAVHERLAYVPGSTTVETCAEEALAGGSGVCQDFAQVTISVCRGLGLLAKYVAGIYTAEGATHAWIEVYQGGRWHPLDPTNDCAVGDSYVKISNGRDYGDCLLSIGVFNGSAEQSQTVHARVDELACAEQ